MGNLHVEMLRAFKFLSNFFFFLHGHVEGPETWYVAKGPKKESKPDQCKLFLHVINALAALPRNRPAPLLIEVPVILAVVVRLLISWVHVIA